MSDPHVKAAKELQLLVFDKPKLLNLSQLSLQDQEELQHWQEKGWEGRKRGLILINAAPGYKKYFSNIAKEFSRRGVDILYAMDSRYSIWHEPCPEIDNSGSVILFSDYLRAREKETRTDGGPRHDVSWARSLFPDVDRFLVHNYNLNRPKGYWAWLWQCLNDFFSELLTSNKIDFVLYENVSNSFAMAAFRQAEALGLPYFGLMPSRIPGRFEVQRSIFDESNEIASLKDEEATAEELEWARAYVAGIADVEPDYMAYNKLSDYGFFQRNFKLSKLRKAIRVLGTVGREESRYSYQRARPLLMLYNGMRLSMERALRARIITRYYEDPPPASIPFYVYPIHYHPESSTSVLAPRYVDEYSNILNISMALPVGTYLCVKDHRSAFGTQALGFYKKVSKIPNVYLVRPDLNIKKIILDSLGVITINSTAGYEALLLGKPVYLFGRVFYEKFEGVVPISGFENLEDILGKCAIAHEAKRRIPIDDLIAYRRYTYEGSLNLMGAPDPAVIRRIADVVENALRGKV